MSSTSPSLTESSSTACLVSCTFAVVRIASTTKPRLSRHDPTTNRVATARPSAASPPNTWVRKVLPLRPSTTAVTMVSSALISR